jgi:hypothetical protein
MLYFPAASKAVAPDGKRPALISVMQGASSEFSFSSMKKVPDGFRSRARTAASDVSIALGAATVFARLDNENTPLGLFPAAK